MKKLIYLSILVLLLLLDGCAPSDRIGLTDSTNFIELPFPSNNYMPGQIVEIYTRPTKVEITHQSSDLNWSQISSSPGWNIATNKTEEIKGGLSLKIASMLKGKYSYASTQNVKVNFTDTKTSTIQKITIYSSLKESISNNSDLKDLIEDSMEDGTYYDVITQVISANISFTLTDLSNNSIDIDSELIEKINSQFDIDFTKSDVENTVISGTNLIIGIHSDPTLVKKILKRI